MDIDQGPCTEMETRWAYDLSRKECVTFEYGGCGGNRNNFPSDEYCSYYCPSRLAPEPEPEPEPAPVPDIESPSGTDLRFAGIYLVFFIFAFTKSINVNNQETQKNPIKILCNSRIEASREPGT